MMSGERSKPRLHSLTGLRFFAAFAIVIFHAAGWFPPLRPLQWIAPWSLGVSFFFVLSGFVLAYNYPSGIDWPRFIAARVARIWPLHIFCLLVAFLFIPFPWTHPPGPDAWQTLATVFLFQAWWPDGNVTYAINGVAWSISVELFFYCCFPVIIARWGKWGFAPIVVAILLVVVFLTFASMANLPVRQWGEPGLSGRLVGLTFPPVRLLEFVLGVAAAKLCLAYPPVRLSLLASTLLELLAVCALAVSIFYINPILMSYFEGVATIKWIHQSGSCLGFALLIYLFACFRGAISYIISSRIFIFLGEISFSIYMTHVLVLQLFVRSLPYSIRDAGPITCLIYFVIVLLVSALTWAFVERPLRAVIVEYFDRLVAYRKAIQRCASQV
jgi:peptidoglycan/LPS O-acetylase OafA/YrhL